jgi:putative ABC transport system permease protein
MFWIRTAFKELITHKGFSLFFILNLALGLAGFIAIQSFRESLDRHMDDNLKEILTADLVLSSYNSLTQQEMQQADRILAGYRDKARLVTFFSMARGHDRSRLVRVMAMDGAYPLYGGFTFEEETDSKDIQGNPGLFMTRDTARALGIKTDSLRGKPVKLGEKEFLIQDFFKDDPDKTVTGLELAPKVYMGLDQLAGTGLIRFGSRVRYLYYYRFEPGVNLEGKIHDLKQHFYDPVRNQPRLNVYDARDVNQRLGRISRYFTRYMGLVSIIALFLAGMAAAYLFRGFLTLKSKEMAILMAVGAARKHIYFYVSFQLILLGTLSAGLAVIVSMVLLPVFPVIFKDLIPAHLNLGLSFETLAVALVVGVAGSLMFCLPLFVTIFSIRPLTLLQGHSVPVRLSKRKTLWQALSFVPVIAALFLMSVIVSGGMVDGAVFAGGFILALGVFSLIGGLVFWGCRFPAASKQIPVKIAFRNLFRNKWSSLSCFVTIAMGVFLIAIVPQVRKGLETEIIRPKGLKIPVLFLADIQEAQKEPLIRFMEAEEGDLTRISPMVRGRIKTVNGRPFHGRRDESGERARGRRLAFIFSFRKTLDASEKVVQGAPISKNPWEFGSNTPFEISLERSFAERHQMKIGDALEVDIQGISLIGKVVNLRQVKWTSFQPNFFMLFQDGVLNDAPKSYLAGISNLPQSRRHELKNEIVDRFPNISVIDVTQTAQTILGVTDRLSLSVKFMAWLAIAAGLLSIFSISRHEAFKNRNQINLLKVLGTDFNTLKLIILLESGFVGFSAGITALCLSVAVSFGISWYFFDSLWQLDGGTLFLILCLSTVTCMATGLGAAWQVMKARPVQLLGQG